jgi:hypothetical protein
VALKLGRIATPDTIAAWIERAERRTVKHLCEEIEAAEMLARNGAIAQLRPPTDEELAAVFALEEALLNGELLPKPPKGWHDDEDVPGEDAGGAARRESDEGSASAALPAPQISDELSAGVDLSTPQRCDGVLAADQVLACAAWPAPQISDAAAWRASSEMAGVGSDAIEDTPQISDDPLRTLVAAGRAELIGMMTDDADRVQGLPKAVEQVFRHRGMATLRLRLPEHLLLRWKALAASHRRIRGKQESFVMFLCKVAWREWAPEIDVEVKFKHIHTRDRFRCLCPVCTKRNIGPHHMQRRIKGGNDTKENNVSACYVCHLPGIHRQCWLKVEPTPNGLRWTIGLDPTLVVEGREVIHERRSSLQYAA